MTKLTERFARHRPQRPQCIIDPVAFFLALVGGPILFTLATCWLMVPVFALVLGGPIYLAIGTPLLLWSLRNKPANPIDLAWLAFCAVIVVLTLTVGSALALTDDAEIAAAAFYLIAGLLFGPLWAVSFAKLYNKLQRDFYAQPIGC